MYALLEYAFRFFFIYARSYTCEDEVKLFVISEPRSWESIYLSGPGVQVSTLFLASRRKLILSPKRIVLVLTQDDRQNP